MKATSGLSGTVIAPDGTAYAWMTDANAALMVAAFDPAGTVRPGWPIRVISPGSEPSLVVATDGTLLVGTHGGDLAGFVLHRVGADGREIAGWPYREGASDCSRPVVGLEGTTVLACSRRDGQTSTIVVIDAGGRVVPGWPVRFDRVERLDSVWGEAVQVGPDGTIYALGTPNDPREMAHLWAHAPDGSVRPGFPVALESRAAGYLLARDRLLVGSYIPPDNADGGLCAEAGGTILGELDSSGRVVAGWPVTATGWASRPVIGDDGTVFYLARDRFFARDPNGSIRAGWPVAIAPVYPECADYGPYLGADGTVYVMDDGLTAYRPDGRVRPGWPFEPTHGLAGWFCTTDAAGGPRPVFGSDGRVYAAVVGASDADGAPVALQIVALDPTGAVVSGWPYTLPGEGRGEVQLVGVVDGRLYVSVSRCGASDSSTVLLALDPDGSISD